MQQPQPAQLQPQVSGAPFTQDHPQQSYQGPRPVVLLILDGWGIGPHNAGNAITLAKTPNMDKYWVAFPHTQLAASGEAVGLPHEEDGNTETGHLNIGAGSIVYQDLPRINMAIADGSFANNQAFVNAFNHVRKHNSTLHLMGLVGAGGVHSNIEHLYALLNVCKTQNILQVYIHGFTDGRDSPPTSGINYVQQIMERCKKLGIGQVATLMGRYYAMDRDKRWERIEKAYNALTIGSDTCTTDPIGAMQQQYDQNITDEFIEPISICNQDGTHRVVQDNDAVIFFNYRIDRPRELTRAFVLPNFEQGIVKEAFDPYTIKYKKTHLSRPIGGTTFQRQKVLQNLYFTTMTRYEEGLPVDVAFPPQFVKNPLGKVLADHGLRQLRIAETEKEKFVTYYMNGQQDTIFPGEDRVIVPSKGAKSYDLIPEMSAREITAEILTRINQNIYDAVICNLANADMVGHTGNLEATIQACQVIDEVVGQIVAEVFRRDGVVLITADHGNAEELIDVTTGQVDTEHSIYPVPLIIIGKQFMNQATMLPSGILADVAPTMLHIMGLEKTRRHDWSSFDIIFFYGPLATGRNTNYTQGCMSLFEFEAITTWSSSPYALLALSVLSFSESAFFIIPPELLLIPMALANPVLALWFGVVTTVTSVAGAVFGYLIGQKGGKPVLHRFFSKKNITTVKKLFHRYDTKAIFISAFTPIPYKVFTISAGVFDLHFQRFVIASLIGRGARYLLIAGLIAVFGDSIRYFLEHQFDKAVALGTIALVLVFVIYKFGLPFIEQRWLKESVADRIKRIIGF